MMSRTSGTTGKTANKPHMQSVAPPLKGGGAALSELPFI